MGIVMNGKLMNDADQFDARTILRSTKDVVINIFNLKMKIKGTVIGRHINNEP